MMTVYLVKRTVIKMEKQQKITQTNSTKQINQNIQRLKTI